MCAKLLKTVITEFYDDYTVVTYVKETEAEETGLDIKETGDLPIIVETSRSWDTNYYIKMPAKSELKRYIDKLDLNIVRVEFMGKIFYGKIDQTGRVYALSKMYEFARNNDINFESKEKVVLSYRRDKKAILVGFLND